MIEKIKFETLNKYLIPSLGGSIGGLSVSHELWIVLMPISLSILWSGFNQKISNYLWGFFFVLISHHWLIYLHPLTWLGYTWLASLIISFSILIICSIFGGLLISLWGFLGESLFIKRNLFSYTNYQIFIKILFLSCLWALGELILKQTPFFWIGVGESLIPGDLYLSGLARWCGASGLCTIQLMIGFWLFFIYEHWRQKIKFRKIFYIGILIIINLHFIGAFLITPQKRAIDFPVALWQTNIPTREKGFINNKLMYQKLFSAQKDAISKDAKLLITPEGTLDFAFIMENPSLIDIFAGGFRISEKHLKSSLLAFKKGDKSYSDFIDKHRLVPLGEKLPNILNRFSVGFSSLGGLHSGQASRFFNWDKTPLAIAICYEISDGLEIRKAIQLGSELIISISNLDPYPIKVQKQFISLASLRSIENNRDNVIISNTGPTGLIRNDGRIANLLPTSIEQVNIVYPNFLTSRTIYNRVGDKPLLILSIILISLNLRSMKRSTN